MESHTLHCVVPADEDFHVFTTFRLDTNLVVTPAHIATCGGKATDIYLLPYHYRRLKDAIVKMSGFEVCEALMSLESFEHHIRVAAEKLAIDSPEDGYQADGEPHLGIIRRGKFSIWPSGRVEVTLTPVPSSSSHMECRSGCAGNRDELVHGNQNVLPRGIRPSPTIRWSGPSLYHGGFALQHAWSNHGRVDHECVLLTK
jgi:hypothetical protein